MNKNKIRLLVVDDTKFMRKALREIFEKDDELEVVGTAKDGKDALDQIPKLKPDVVTMDIDMPTMDGLTSLKHIMMKFPVPVVVISALADNPDINFESWRLGSVEFIKKPSGSVSDDIAKQKNELIARVKKTARVNLNNVKRVPLKHKLTKKTSRPQPAAECLDFIIGGAGSLNSIIRIMKDYNPENNRSVVTLLDFKASTLFSFHKRLNDISKVNVLFADQSTIIPGSVCILASTESSIQIEFQNDNYFLRHNAKVEKNSFEFLEKLPEYLYKHSNLILLAGDESLATESIKHWYDRGGKIYFQTPESCLFSQFINNALTQKIKAEKISIDLIGHKLSKM